MFPILPQLSRHHIPHQVPLFNCSQTLPRRSTPRWDGLGYTWQLMPLTETYHIWLYTSEALEMIHQDDRDCLIPSAGPGDRVGRHISVLHHRNNLMSSLIIEVARGDAGCQRRGGGAVVSTWSEWLHHCQPDSQNMARLPDFGKTVNQMIRRPIDDWSSRWWVHRRSTRPSAFLLVIACMVKDRWRRAATPRYASGHVCAWVV